MKHRESLLSTAGVEALGLSLITKWQHIFSKLRTIIRMYSQNISTESCCLHLEYLMLFGARQAILSKIASFVVRNKINKGTTTVSFHF